ncbi:hypothetical protein GGS23DRAFT_70066 [Durotheca rogersii]|uniref:uncharacterized protein n=1 Tax=Durotheca rogersii TaxID=419775 RepID=UPI002220A170|nr:uncharacterized protein GGS23DRAFT_70066 [Durotheca rogersii]KAI5862829.1 hypothetical protein GGS23DRAFT_70066 [Durotheca rogersii]
MRPQPILYALLFATHVVAQGRTSADDGDVTTPTGDGNTPTPTSARRPQTTEETSPQTSTERTRTTEEASTTERTSTTNERTSTTERTSEQTTATTSTTDASPPSSSASTSEEPLPTLPGHYSYPPPSVPPTQNAPFMQPSNVPEGTVFIAVGAILGAFGAAVLIWRAVVVCLLHRSVKKAAMAQHIANDKATYLPPAAPFYKYTDHASTASLANGSASRGVRRTTRGPIPSSTPSQSNLFFSPTAPTAPGGGGGSNRESRFLPSGFYAAGAGSPQPGHGHSISLTNLRPDSRGHGRPLGHTPPESPSLRARPDLGQRDMSASSLNLNRPPSGRAPSAFLEDLLDDQQNQFPPSGLHHQHTWSQPHNRQH